MKKTLLSMLLALAVVPVFAGPAAACSCVPGGPKALAERAEVLFAGTVANISGGQSQTVTFDVETAFKGAVEDEVAVTSAVSSAACGLPFQEGRRYTVFAYNDGGQLMTNSCSGTRLGSIDTARYGLSEGREISGAPASANQETPSSNQTQTWPFIAIGALVLVGGGFVLSRKLSARASSTSSADSL